MTVPFWLYLAVVAPLCVAVWVLWDQRDTARDERDRMREERDRALCELADLR